MLQGSKSSKSLQHVKLLLPGVELAFPLNQREKHTSTSSWSFFPAIWKWTFWKTTLSLTHHSLEVSQGFRETKQQEEADAKPLVLKSSCSAESPGKFFKTVRMPGFDTMALVFLKAAKLEDHCNTVYEFHIKALDKLRLKETLPHLSWKMNPPPHQKKRGNSSYYSIPQNYSVVMAIYKSIKIINQFTWPLFRSSMSETLHLSNFKPLSVQTPCFFASQASLLERNRKLGCQVQY